MKKLCVVFLLAVLLLTGCATGAGDDPNAPKITIRMEQLDNTNGNNFQTSRPVNIRFALYVTNATVLPVTISRVEFRTVDVGAYVLQPTSASLNIPISPAQTIRTVISAWGTSQGGHSESRQPVTVHGTAYLLGTNGSFIQTFTENFRQY